MARNKKVLLETVRRILGPADFNDIVTRRKHLISSENQHEWLDFASKHTEKDLGFLNQYYLLMLQSLRFLGRCA